MSSSFTGVGSTPQYIYYGGATPVGVTLRIENTGVSDLTIIVDNVSQQEVQLRPAQAMLFYGQFIQVRGNGTGSGEFEVIHVQQA